MCQPLRFSHTILGNGEILFHTPSEKLLINDFHLNFACTGNDKIVIDSTRIILVEASKHTGPRIMYGCLGAVYHPSKSDSELEINIAYENDDGKAFDSKLFERT